MTEVVAPPSIEQLELPGWRPELIALDLDGTCVDGYLRLDPRIAAAVASAAKQLPVVVATGRMYRSALPWARKLGVTAPLVCYQGALVQELPDRNSAPGAVLSHIPLGALATRRAIATARAHGWHRQGYFNDRLLCEEDRPELDFYRDIAGVEITFVDDLAEAVRGGSTKLVCVITDEAGAMDCETVMRSSLGGLARVTRSQPQFVEITDPAATKSEALRRVCREFGVAMEHCIAVGDAPNDIDMLAAVGFGVAVAGAKGSVLQVAAAVCQGPQQGGVAAVLRAFGLA